MKRVFVALMLIVPFQVHAVLITYDGANPGARGDWVVTRIKGTFEKRQSKLVDQIWFGDGALAREFAELVGDGLGFPNSGGNNPAGDAGPIFAWRYDIDTVSPVGARAVFANDPSVGVNIGVSNTETLTWAKARRINVPEPGALSLLGAGLLALGVMRRKRAA